MKINIYILIVAFLAINLFTINCAHVPNVDSAPSPFVALSIAERLINNYSNCFCGTLPDHSKCTSKTNGQTFSIVIGRSQIGVTIKNFIFLEIPQNTLINENKNCTESAIKSTNEAIKNENIYNLFGQEDLLVTGKLGINPDIKVFSKRREPQRVSDGK